MPSPTGLLYRRRDAALLVFLATLGVLAFSTTSRRQLGPLGGLTDEWHPLGANLAVHGGPRHGRRALDPAAPRLPRVRGAPPQGLGPPSRLDPGLARAGPTPRLRRARRRHGGGGGARLRVALRLAQAWTGPGGGDPLRPEPPRRRVGRDAPLRDPPPPRDRGRDVGAPARVPRAREGTPRAPDRGPRGARHSRPAGDPRPPGVRVRRAARPLRADRGGRPCGRPPCSPSAWRS